MSTTTGIQNCTSVSTAFAVFLVRKLEPPQAGHERNGTIQADFALANYRGMSL